MPASLFIRLGIISVVAPALVAAMTVSRFMASAMVLVGEVCQVSETSMIGVKRPSQPNRRISYETAASRSAWVSASCWPIMPMVSPSLGACP